MHYRSFSRKRNINTLVTVTVTTSQRDGLSAHLLLSNRKHWLLIVDCVTVEQAKQVLGQLSTAIGCVDPCELFERHMVDVLNSMDNSYDSWTQHSAERFVFDALVLEAGETVCLSVSRFY